MPQGVRYGGDDSAALAANWRTLLLIDSLLGFVVFFGGLALVVSGRGWAYIVMIAGVLYLFFVGGRVTKWRRIRRAAGLG
ncbi:MAG: hypothetical protein NVSMB16_09450 [Acidimicrobiales bacterium]